MMLDTDLCMAFKRTRGNNIGEDGNDLLASMGNCCTWMETDLCLTEEPSHKALTTHSVVHMYLRPLARQEIDAVQGQEVNKTATM